jgi:RNA polymerase sigma factor (sigma-70 family)
MQTTDAMLLQGFSQNADETCFEELVRRYSALVMGVCHRILQNTADAEEAFQNTFLTLARKANSLSGGDSISAWIHEVAFRTSLKIRHAHLAQGKKQAAFQAHCDIEYQESHQQWDELRIVIDEELNQIVEKYRLPLIACYLEGKDTDEAAEQSQLNPNTFRVRLMRGKDLLKKRLSRRGITLSVATAAALLVQKGSVVASESLIKTTLQAAKQVSLEGAAGTGGITAARGILSKQILVGAGIGVAAVLTSLVLFHSSKNPLQDLDKEIVRLKEGSEVVRQAAPVRELLNPGAMSEVVEYPSSVEDYLVRLNGALQQPKPLRWQLVRRLGINLADNDLDEVESFILPPGASKNGSVKHPNFHSSLFSYWPKMKPQSAADWTARLLNFPSHGLPETYQNGLYHSSNNQQWLFQNILTEWAAKDSWAALEWSSRHLNPNHRVQGVSIALRECAKEDFRGAFLFLKSDSARLQLVNNHSVLSAFVGGNPTEVAAWIQQLQNDASSEKEVNKIIFHAANMLAAKDSRFALEWALGLSQSNEDNKKLRSAVVQKTASDWAAKDAVGAMTWLGKISDNPEKEQLLDVMIISQVRSLSRDDSSLFLDFVKSVEELPKDYHERAFCELVRTRRPKHDKQAYSWIQSQTQVALKDALWAAYATSNCESFSAAMGIVEQIQNSQVRLTAQQILMKRASELENSAQHILNSSLPHDKKDLVLTQLCTSKQISPKAVLLIAEKIHDPKTKNAILVNAIKDWMTQDREAAKNWVFQSSLTQEMKSSLVASP